MNEKLKFRISSALKNLIGKELITDQYIAIFELVKNSFDAYSDNVTLEFTDLGNENARISIKDDGKGMDYDDLINKWLFVAYSAKKDGTEDIKENIMSSDDYRDKIKSKRIFAGAKGVGRFSCDRLGSKLNLITVKNIESAVAEKLTVNWLDFEEDSKKEFMDIDVNHEVVAKNKYNLEQGTILEITNLRDVWDREALLKLKSSLEKLINPNQENDSRHFSINIIAPEQLDEDMKSREKIIEKGKKAALKEGIEFSLEDINWELESNRVNGKINNSLFETLGIKSTYIISEISADGLYVTSTVTDRGVMIYRVKEKNLYSVSNIKIILFFLNPKAKSNFTRLMGVQPVNYGSVFMYKNGFRIYPYGEFGEDIFGIDRRKAQGHSRFIGTRDLLGRVEIYGENDGFRESTSRDGGLIKNDNYFELQEFFIKTLRRLEKYVVDIASWGNISITDEEINGFNMSPDETKKQIRGYIESLTNTKDIMHVEYDENFLKTIKEKQKNSVSSTLQELQNHAIKINDPLLAKKTELFEKEYTNVLTEKNRLEIESQEKTDQLIKTTIELGQKNHQNLFLKSVSTLDYDNILSLHHQIGIYSTDIEAQLLLWNRKLNRGQQIEINELKNFLDGITILNNKILSVSKFATKANFSLNSEILEADLFTFVEQYISNIYITFASDPINITFINLSNEEFVLNFKPIEFTIIIDNILNNSRKARARNIEIIAEILQDKAKLTFKDDGNGLKKSIHNPEEIFEKGFTTTSGSGLGLFHVRQIIEDLNGKVTINNNTSGFELLLEVQK
ncbi:sensor histidine kinase [Paenibacillus lautus]|uniref:sensor histidine kinase n=1 Tax=Paenibacillus lautus TaxID=1401 RepID=UPI003D266B80